MRFSSALVLLALVTTGFAACSDHLYCDDCIHEPLCGWCGDSGSCLAGSVGATGCAAYWQYPDSEVVSSPYVSGSIFRPTSLEIFLRPGHVLNVDIDVTPNRILPLDILILEDMSSSFADDLSTFESLLGSFFSDIRAYQSDTRFGVASFIDKPVPPFAVDTDYVFKVHQELTTNDADVSGAFSTSSGHPNPLIVLDGGDTPEAQLEGLVFAAMRDSEVGWRSDARRVVLLSTDAPYHAAGEGFFAGISKRNNGDAVADTNGAAGVAGLGEDFPSVPQVQRILLDTNVVPIFCVTSNHIGTYEGVVRTFGFGAVNLLEEDSSNIVEAVIDALRKVDGKVSLRAGSDDVYALVANVAPETPYEGVELGSTVTFEVTFLTSTELPDSTGGVTSLTLVVPGFGSIPVDVDTNYACDCVGVPCPGTPECSGNGTCACGRCDCVEGNVGRDCACDTEAPCKDNCNGRGFCRNCECECFASFEGETCECPTTCPGTPECLGRGVCSCGECSCLPGYSGEMCECDERAVCEGGCLNGVCRCGVCECDPGFVGSNCEDCASDECNVLRCAACVNNDCNGHGTCCNEVGENATCTCGNCICTDGWTTLGPEPEDVCTCNTMLVCDPPCQNGGNCTCGECECPIGYSGALCEICETDECKRCQSGCLLDCSGNGFCNCTTCECYEGFSGDFCSCQENATCPGGCGNGVCTCGSCVCADGYITIDTPCDTCTDDTCAIFFDCDYSDCEACKADVNCGWCSDKDVCLPKESSDNGASCGGFKESCTTVADFIESPLGVAVLVLGILLIIFAVLALLFMLIQKAREAAEWQAYEKELNKSKWANNDNQLYKKQEKEGHNPLYAG